MNLFRDREQAGKILAGRLPSIEAGSVVLAIPNGGVLVGAALARELKLPLHLLVIRKIQLPWNTESGFGAVASDGSVLYNKSLLPQLGLSREEIEAQTEQARASVRERIKAYGAEEGLPALKGKTVILTDDGLASGITMEAALQVARGKNPQKIIVAVPTASRSAAARIKTLADDFVCPDVRGGRVFAVADAYANWRDVEDDEVKAALAGSGNP